MATHIGACANRAQAPIIFNAMGHYKRPLHFKISSGINRTDRMCVFSDLSVHRQRGQVGCCQAQKGLGSHIQSESEAMTQCVAGHIANGCLGAQFSLGTSESPHPFSRRGFSYRKEVVPSIL